MKTFLNCLPCFVDQALRAGRIATDNEDHIKKILDEVGMMLKDIPMENTPPASGREVYRLVREITGNPDPYIEIKRESTQKALSMYSELKDRLDGSEDRLLTAVKIAIAGNIIDFGINHSFDLKKIMEEVLVKDFAICDYTEFKEALDRTEKILFIGDNAGESVFDRILIEEIDKEIIYAVRGEPVINDATYDDAIQAGLDKVATIMSSGTDAPGTILNTCNSEFLTVFNSAPFIISKGQGNYEALSGEPKQIFFMLMAKCQVVADDIGVNRGDIILKKSLGDATI